MVEKKRVFQYQEISDEAFMARASEREEKRDSFIKQGTRYYISKEKTNKLRILPPTWKNPKHYGYDAWIHYGIGKSNSSYLCPIKMGVGNKCPICEEITTGASKDDKEFVDKVKARRKVLVYVIDRDNPADGPKVFPMPFSMDRNFVVQAVDDGTGAALRIHHPDEGYDISFEKDGIGIKTKYSGERISRKSTPLSSNPVERDNWLQLITDKPISEVLDIKSYDYIKDAFEGRIVEEEEEVKEIPIKHMPFVSKPEPNEVPTPKKYELSREDKEDAISDFFGFRMKQIREMDDETVDAHYAKMKGEEAEQVPTPKATDGAALLDKLKGKYGRG